MDKIAKKIADNYWYNKLQYKESQLVANAILNKSQEIVLDENELKYFDKLTQKNEIIANTVYLGLFDILLQRYFQESTLIFSRSAATQYKPLLYKSIICKDKIVKTYLNEFKKEFQEVYKYKGYDNELLTKKDFEAFTSYGLCYNRTEEILESKQGFVLDIQRKEANVQLTVHYNESFVTAEVVNHFVNTYANWIKNLETVINEIATVYTILSEGEKHKLEKEFNNTRLSYTEDKTLVDVLEEQVVKTPEEIVLYYKEKQLTYIELNEEVNRLANYLITEKAIQKGDFVGIKLERNEQLLIAILAVLKSGATYIPLDVKYPEERILYIEKDSKCHYIIDNENYHEFENNKKQYAVENINRSCTAKDLAYVIYTSGTTGRPKGVMITHGNAIALLNWAKKEFEASAFEIIYASTSHCFDLSVFEMFFPIITGKKLRILDSALEIGTYISRDKNIMINTVPSSMRNILEEGCDLSQVTNINLAGEPFPVAIAKQLFQTKAEIRNLYGPSEDTTYSTTYQLINTQEYTTIPIGKPISNTQAYVLDEQLQLVPVGVAGKLYLSGKGITNGYLNQEKLTAQKFIENPFDIGTLMYDTGDLVKWTSGGNLIFLGRKDHQIKLRGYRIELEEIENTILGYTKEITQVVVLVKKINDIDQLIAYVETHELIDQSQLKEFLIKKLPVYMIPNQYIKVASIPLTPNGKINKQALLELEHKKDKKLNYVAPSTSEEQAIVAIWEEILQETNIGIEDNFFELGGHSLMIGQVINKIYKELGKGITYQTFFEYPTIKQLSQKLVKNTFEKIYQAPIQSTYPITATQHRLWILSQFTGASQAYHISGGIRLKGNIDITNLETSFKQLIDKYEILRTGFETNNQGEVIQRIYTPEQINFSLNYKEINDEVVLKNLLYKEQNQPFDLTRSPLLKGMIIKKEENDYILSLVMHHIIGDGWSLELMLSEVIEKYNALVSGISHTSETLQIQFKDYVVWLQSQLQNEKHQLAESYWLNQLKGELPILNIPSFKKRPEKQTHNGATVVKEYSTSFLAKLKAFSEQEGTTLFMTLMAGINALLYRYTNQADIILGTPVAGREHPDIENQIGLFVNTLAIRTKITVEESFETLLKKQKQLLIDAYQHQNYPFDTLVQKLNIKRDTSRGALFDVMVAFQNQNQLWKNERTIKDVQIEDYVIERNSSQFDLSFSFTETEVLALEIEYNTDIYDRFWITQIFEHFEHLIDDALLDKEKELSTLNYLTQKEEFRLINEFNKTERDYPQDENVISLFEKQVDRSLNKPAIVFNEITYTYTEFNEEVNQLAHYLRSKYSIATGDTIGILLEPSIRQLCAMFGILKAGGAYVPIAVNYPEERIAYIKEDSKCKLVIDEAFFDNFYSEKETYAKTNLNIEIKPNQLIYIIYTSGTTGKPKGVMVTHSNVSNLLHWYTENFGISSVTRSIQLTQYTFDPSIEDIFGTLLNGGIHHVVSKEMMLSQEKILGYIKEHKITHLNYVPDYIYQLLVNEALIESIETIIVGGEALSENIKNTLIQKGYTLYNNYGPTEITVDALSGKMTAEPVHIGKPIANAKAYILDKQLCPVSIGVYGDLYISGAGVTLGYINKPELTQEKFIENPFEKGQIIYNTGDVVRWLPNGNIEFQGRKDHQVKIRGYRIELGEIEKAITTYSNTISRNVVVVNEQKGEKVLVAYYVSSETIDKVALKTFLNNKLPEYMVPSYFVNLEDLPLTSNGKIDRKALPKWENEDLIRTAYVGARTALEEELVSIWEEVLEVERIGVRDNFFELGGHSLKLTRLRSLISESLGVTLNFEELFSYTTIEEQGEVILKKSREEVIEIPKIVAQDKYVLSSAQQRIWMLSQFEGGNTAYNMPGVYELEGTVDKSVLEASFIALMKRHESLRTRFKEKEGELYQEILKENSISFELAEKEVAGLAEAEREIEEAIAKEFDLSSGELLQAKYIRVSTGEQFLVLMMHHIISDGWSIGVMMHELIENYKELVAGRALKRAPLRIHYKDYAQWEQNYIRGEAIVESKAYWHEQLNGEIPIIDLPIAQERPKQKDYSGAQEVRFLSREITDGLKRLSQEKEMTLYMVVLAMIKLIIHRYSGAKDIIIGSPIAGRINKEIEDQIGVYINTLAIRTRYTGEERVVALLDQVKNSVLKAYEHQRYPFDKLVEELPLARDIGRHPLFDIMVTMQNIEGSGIGLQKITEELTIRPCEQQRVIKSKFDLEFIIEEKSEGIEIAVQYSSSLYKAEAIKKLLVHLERLIKSSIAKPEAKLYEQEMLIREEQEALIWGIKGKEEALVEETLIEAIRAQVARRGEAIAIGDGASEISYNELERRSNAIANYIETHYPGEGPIGVLLDREVATIVVLLGIIKTGRAYIPLDPRYPQERIDYIITHSGLEVMIVGTGLEIEKAEGIAYISIEEIQRADTAKDRVSERKVTPSDTAYIIYTSGSTGNPKGVAIGHESLYNFLRSIQAIPGIGEQDTLYAVTTYAFDISILEFFVPLISGAKVYIASNEVLSDAKELIKEIEKVSPSVIQSTPSFYQMLYEVGWKGDKRCKILCGGDNLNEQLATRLVADNQELWNMYGPTETTIWSTQHRVLKGSAYKEIGRAINNTSLYVLGSQKELLPQGAIGELYIGGKGLAQGYYKAEELTQERFISNPYGEGKIYKTGDLVKLNESGNIEFIGRNDSQVKIRGYRIELGEVTSKLNKQKGVKQGVVLVKQDNVGNNMLIAYIEKATDDSIEGIRKELGESLPAYMLPSQYVEVSVFPLTPNGKIDRKALKEIEVELVKTKEYVEARTTIEQELVLIWEEVLGVEKIGIRDNFFELGGHSLNAIKVISKIEKRFDIKISINRIFEHTTIEDQAILVENIQIVNTSSQEEENPETTFESFSI